MSLSARGSADVRMVRCWLNAAVEPHESEASEDTMRLTIDGEVFDVAYDPEQPGAYHYRRLTGPAPGYGFTVRKSDHARSTTAEGALSGFLS